VGLYTRRQLLLLLGLVAAAGLGLAVGHWRAHHPALAGRLESLDRRPPGFTDVPRESTDGATPPGSIAPSTRGAPRGNRAGRQTGVADGGRPAATSGPAGMPAGAGPAPDLSRPRKPGGPSQGQPPAFPVDINRASLADLTRLPGVGPALASRILQARELEGPFTSIDDLRRVRGVGPSTLERLRPHVTAGE